MHPGITQVFPLDGFLPPWRDTYTTHARTVVLVDWCDNFHSMVAPQLCEVPSPEILAVDSLLTHRLDAPAFAAPHRDRRRLHAPLSVTLRGAIHILLFVDRSSLHGAMFSVTAAEFTAEGTANSFINRYIPPWGCPRSNISNKGLQFCSKFSHAILTSFLALENLPPAPPTPTATALWSVPITQERKQMLATVVTSVRQDGWDAQLPGIKTAERSRHAQVSTSSSRGFRAHRGC